MKGILPLPRLRWLGLPGAVIIATTVLVLAGCGGRPSSTGGSPGAGGSPGSTSALGFSQCMRAHGVPNFPDPDGSGTIPKETARQLGVSSSQYQTAQSACAHLLPNRGVPSQPEIQQTFRALRSFAQCMRTQGVSNWPDPSTDSEGDPIFYLQGQIDENSPQIVTKIHACQHLVPPGSRVGGPPGGVPMCPGDRPGPDATSACGGPNQGG